jgi:hypothetical protein
MRAGWYWIFFRPCLMTWSRWAKPVKATLASGPRLRLDQMPSAVVPLGCAAGRPAGSSTRGGAAGTRPRGWCSARRPSARSGPGSGPASTAGPPSPRPPARRPAAGPAPPAGLRLAGTGSPALSTPARARRPPPRPAAAAAPTAPTPAARRRYPRPGPAARTSPPPPAGPVPAADGPRRLNRHPAHTPYTVHTAGNRPRHPRRHCQLKIFSPRHPVLASRGLVHVDELVRPVRVVELVTVEQLEV